MSSPVIRLIRPWWARALTGFRLQGLFVVFALALLVRFVALAAGSAHGQPGIPGTLVAVLVLAAADSIGATGWAEADDAGVRWRYWTRHSFGWQQIERLELQLVSVGITGVRHLVAVRVGGRDHRITPVADGGRQAREFGRALAEQAASRGIAVVDAWDRNSP